MIILLNLKDNRLKISILNIKVVIKCGIQTILGASKSNISYALARQIFLCALLSLIIYDGHAQKTKKKADKLFESLGYMASAKLYEQLEGDEKNDEVMARLATSYRLNGNYADAEYWYSRLVQLTDDPVYYLHYAQMLQSNLKCQEAIEWYKKYYDTTGDDRRYYIQDCLELRDIPHHRKISITNVADLNSNHMDFCAVPLGNGIVITSSRTEKGIAIRKDLWTQDHFCDMFYADVEKDGSFSNVRPFNGDSDINGKFHDGSPAFSQNGDYMIFTRNNNKGKNKDGIRDLKLYEAHNEEGFWTNVRELPINDNDFSCAHPTLSKDGRRLYFSSNRPGGYGGMDVYLSEKVGNTWQEPINLGPEINTSGNEIFPFISEDESLYFSSNGHQGLGGLDFFSVKKTDVQDETSWTGRENLGKPFNSEKDDVGFYIDPQNESGYFSSNRIGGHGEDDIYRWTGDLKNVQQDDDLKRNICVYDEKSGERIEEVTVTILKTSENDDEESIGNRDMLLTLKPLDETNNEYVLSIIEKNNNKVEEQEDYTTGSVGHFNYTVQPENNYIFVLEKQGYSTLRKTVSAKDILRMDEYCFEMRRRSCLGLNGVVKNKDYPAFIPNAEVKLFNKCTGEIEATITDKMGKFDFCLDCGCDYEIYAFKPNFESEMTLLSTLNQDCEAIDLQNSLMATIDMKVGKPAIEDPNAQNLNYPNQPSPYSTPVWPAIPHEGEGGIVYIPLVPPGYELVPGKNFPPNKSLNNYFLGDSEKPFEQGQTIKLSNIYYDFDEYYIRNDAMIEMNHVLHLLQTYPTMEVALIAHTDSRGSENYNERLSRNRSKAAVKYLIKNGIDANRLVPVGLGESRLVTDCPNGKKCSEDEHQQNRRTEIRILKLDEPGTRVIYDD